MMFNGLMALMSVTGAVPNGRTVPQEHSVNANQVKILNLNYFLSSLAHVCGEK